MSDEIGIGNKIFLSAIGKNEAYIQNLILENPSIIGLGNLIVIEKERKQSSGGRIDFLLKNPEDNTMYEVELMLGETDPSHIIRSIEYWDIEKRRFPLRSHFCVLIAESFSRRYFNVIQLLGLNIPIIAIQLDALNIGERHIIHFTKILDIYEEQEDDESSIPVVTEAKWNEKAKWTVEVMQQVFNQIKEVDDNITLKYLQSYITINQNGKNLYTAYEKSSPSSMFYFHVIDDEIVEKIKNIFNSNGIVYNYNKYKDFTITISPKNMIKKEILLEVHRIRTKEEKSDIE